MAARALTSTDSSNASFLKCAFCRRKAASRDCCSIDERGRTLRCTGVFIVSAGAGGIISKPYCKSPPGDGSGGCCAMRLRRGELLRMANRARRGGAVLGADRLAL